MSVTAYWNTDRDWLREVADDEECGGETCFATERAAETVYDTDLDLEDECWTMPRAMAKYSA